MSESSKPESSHVTSGIAIVAILFSLFAVQETIFKPTRPPMINAERAFSEDTRSRLWQDPFQAVQEHRKYHQNQASRQQLKAELEEALIHTESESLKIKLPAQSNVKNIVISMPTLDKNYAYEYGDEPTRICFTKGENEKKDTVFYPDSGAIAHSFDELHCEIRKETKNSGSDRVHVLAVMVPGGPYAEDRERRLRSRYAVISALAEHGYVSTDSEHIDFLDFEKTCKAILREIRSARLRKENDASLIEKARICELPNFMPYEWFKPIPNVEKEKGIPDPGKIKRILLLWLDNDAFLRSSYPLGVLDYLKKKIQLITETKLEFNFSVIGPHGSDLLSKMYYEAGKTRDQSILSNTIFYAATATANDRDLYLVPNLYFDGATKWLEEKIKRPINHSDETDRFNFYPDESTKWPKEKIKKSVNHLDETDWHNLYLHESKWFRDKVKRTVSQQDITVQTLLCELTLRGINPGGSQNNQNFCTQEQIQQETIPSPPSHIVLIGEKDNFYSQKLTDTFREYLEPPKQENTSLSNSDDKIHFFTYLRGLDGITSEQSSTHQIAQNDQKGEARNSKPFDIKERLERPVGASQLDYLLGLAEHLKQLDKRIAHEGGIKAIGITGTDTYDKLLILQAFRNKFPGIVFFTTDLDSRLFHPSEIKWTRNLIVASPFGLALGDKAQHDTPPFRDTFQTSTFLSARLALCEKDPAKHSVRGCDVILKEKDNWTKHPRIFEIGNYGAIDISHDTHTPKSIFLSPEIKKAGGSESSINTFLASILIIFFAALIIFNLTPKRYHFKLLLPVSSILIASALCFLFVDFYSAPAGEPVSLLSGVSSWPSTGIKLLAICISICLLAIIYHQSKANRQGTAKNFLLNETQQTVQIGFLQSILRKLC